MDSVFLILAYWEQHCFSLNPQALGPPSEGSGCYYSGPLGSVGVGLRQDDGKAASQLKHSH